MDFTSFKKHHDVSRETFDKIAFFVDLLISWNSKINLMSHQDLEHIWSRHILDASQLLSFIKDGQKICDIGSGNGIPAMILAIILDNNKFILVETRKKRAVFLVQAATELKLKNVVVLNERIENSIIEADILTARAFSDISTMLNLTSNIIIKDKFLLLKGKDVLNECFEAKKNWDFDYKITPSVTAAESFIIEIFNRRRKTAAV